jgi:two-component system response regulator VicR
MREKILVVDDGQSLRWLLQAVLEREGYAVVLASDGKKAVRLAETEKPQLIILDAKMPDSHRIEACAALRANAKTQAIRCTMPYANLP